MRTPVPWYRFWNPGSGFVGGLVVGAILMIIATLSRCASI